MIKDAKHFNVSPSKKDCIGSSGQEHHPNRVVEFVYYKSSRSWNEARNTCREIGGDLAIFQDKRDVHIVTNMFSKHNNTISILAGDINSTDLLVYFVLQGRQVLVLLVMVLAVVVGEVRLLVMMIVIMTRIVMLIRIILMMIMVNMSGCEEEDSDGKDGEDGDNDDGDCVKVFNSKQVEGRWKTIVAAYRRAKDSNRATGSKSNNVILKQIVMEFDT
ncbi:hypothetical protein DPMN_164121 [Dreissena polymorpha]|uniref:C-type lectin domain-containing protein n=1 Tax=Dreissena polymorpha TaxID=45954 RepID=A0A9D4IVA2_DREPO|nr:hypothetical protein DPMN_164121 [Dreissena polymorpha]